jgi:hypothetical protein
MNFFLLLSLLGCVNLMQRDLNISFSTHTTIGKRTHPMFAFKNHKDACVAYFR